MRESIDLIEQNSVPANISSDTLLYYLDDDYTSFIHDLDLLTSTESGNLRIMLQALPRPLSKDSCLIESHLESSDGHSDHSSLGIGSSSEESDVHSEEETQSYHGNKLSRKAASKSSYSDHLDESQPSKMRKTIQNNDLFNHYEGASSTDHMAIFTNILSNYGIRIERAIPVNLSRSLAYAMATAFNAGDISGIADIASNYMRPDVQYRKYSNMNNRLVTSTGPQSIVAFFQSLSIAHPDGTLTVKSSCNDMEGGLQVIRNKIKFLGSVYDLSRYKDVLPEESKELVCDCENASQGPYRQGSKCMTKVLCKIFLDNSNRVIIFDKIMKVTIIPSS